MSDTDGNGKNGKKGGGKGKGDKQSKDEDYHYIEWELTSCMSKNW